MINFVAFVFVKNAEDTQYPGPPVSIADTSAFASLFTHWEPEVKTLIEVRSYYTILPFVFDSYITCHTLQLVEKPLQWAIHTVKPLPSYAVGSVCVMGDAVCVFWL
jgi:salicylate hydroxylase